MIFINLDEPSLDIDFLRAKRNERITCIFFFLYLTNFTVFTTLFRGTQKVLRTLHYPGRTYEDQENSIVKFSTYGHSAFDRSTETSANHEINLIEEHRRELLRV